MTTKKSVMLYVFYSGDWSPTVAGRISLANDRQKGETLDKTLKIETSDSPENQRDSVWDQIAPTTKGEREIGLVIYTMRIYRAVCQKLGIFALTDDFTEYSAAELNPAPVEITNLLLQTIRETFGPDSAADQKRALTRADWFSKTVPEPVLPKLPPIKLPAAGKPLNVKEIVGNYTMLALTVHSIGNRRKVGADVLRDGEEQADKEWLAVSKRLLESDELRDINYTGAKCREYIENRSLPSLVKKGIYIMRRELLEAAIARITEDNEKISLQAEILVRAYPGLLAEAEKRLKKEFNKNDYPKVAELKQRFSISYQLLEIKPPEAEKMSDKIFRQEKEKWQQLWSEAAINAERVLQAGMIEQINELMKKLEPGADGKSKQIRPTALDSITEFLDTFNPRNMQNNQQLKALADRAKEIIKGVSPEVLKQSKNAREYVSTGFQQIKKALETKVEIKPTRAISLED